MDDLRGVRAGMTVRDAAGKTLGKVTRVYAWGFEAERGFWSPYQWVFRHDEVARVEGGVVEVARGPADLQQLAAGKLPSSWRRYTPRFGSASIPGAPGEARAAEQTVATPAPAARQAGTRLSPEEEREAERTRGEAGAPAHG
jgi:hypothetical protein